VPDFELTATGEPALETNREHSPAHPFSHSEAYRVDQIALRSAIIPRFTPSNRHIQMSRVCGLMDSSAAITEDQINPRRAG